MITRQEDTIAAISTPPGEGGIAIVRMSGNKAVSIARKIFSSREPLGSFKGNRAYHGWIVDNGARIDEVVVTFFLAPDSYTGEDVVEISCHGGYFVTRRILELIVKRGARIADPGEFTKRRFINGKIDLSQAEATADIINAKTEAAHRAAVSQLSGELYRRVKKMCDDLINICSLLELELDFCEEEIEFEPHSKQLERILSIENEMKDLLSSYERGRICRDGVKMAIIGRTNVGKSSLLNAIVEKERAIVTDVPGTTRDTLDEILDIEGVLFRVTDTAGIRETDDPVEREGVERSIKAFEEADVVLAVFDGSEPLKPEDRFIIDLLVSKKKRTFLIINKIDLKLKIEESELRRTDYNMEIVRVSALKKTGIDKLIKKIRRNLFFQEGGVDEEVLLTNVRHRESILKAISHIKTARETIEKGLSQEFVVLDLRGALDSLGEITGKTTTDDILNRIFSEFCIGK